MLPVIALIGRKNVGKSMLFNRLTLTNDALVGVNNLGLTRDRRYGFCRWREYQSIIIDTGGIEIAHHGIEVAVLNQARSAISEADLILFVVDAQIGLLPSDYDIMKFLYKFQKSVFIVVNKVDGIALKNPQAEFSFFGIKTIISVSASHGFGVYYLLEKVFFYFQWEKLLVRSDSCCNYDLKSKICLQNSLSSFDKKNVDVIMLAVVGSPNVGKSTFINFILGEDRVVVCNSPGTTRDNVYASIIYNGYRYILIDTAGIRKKTRVRSLTESLSIVRTLKVIQTVTVVLLLIDASCGISNNDLSLLNNILRSGRSVVVGVNKWDLISPDLQDKFKRMCNVRMNFVRFVNVNFISSLCGTGIPCLFESIIQTYYSSVRSVSTEFLTRTVHMAVNKCHPPRVYGKEVKLKYAHMGGTLPPVVIVYGNHVTGLPDNYRRYLSNFFSRSLKIFGSYLDIRFRESK
ncbi:ribosome biogenesis GTPase Der [Blochmannia endosymbiont of Polyrhachis (Hedomyrma) turneri]|uniref:ribosome biogenesis GTPase Der n=1 Tax=Blochmannia endosymbiont of Polyrhachis (Hedomyrma) turneri TaxID=1505596 RepID=UPI00061A7FA5|nr:ribosome biogenesis GTPase Der [Blochmannia endosymbiont of Polyrhachis (Hedomyrma) turneri]AKC60089.1 GTPase Der [Blochmannia endosymbiont of Polyrhachis (Hedomyrma) turneri]